MAVQFLRRVESIDVLRGLTILVMIFVNDVAGVHGAPSWMRHLSPSSGDGMTFVDVVFPAFLFIVGMSIPFVIGGRLERGESLWSVWRHIVIRTASLLIIGVFMVNTEFSGNDGVLAPPLWSLFMYLGVVLTWKAVPRDPGGKRTPAIWLRVAGVVLLVVMALLFRGRGERSILEIRPHWWGILGLIGWAYVVSCLAYVHLRRQMAGLMSVVAQWDCVFLADGAGFFAGLTMETEWVWRAIPRRICQFSRDPVVEVQRESTKAVLRHDSRRTEFVPGFMSPRYGLQAGQEPGRSYTGLNVSL